MSLCPNLRCRSPPAISCWFYLPVVPIALPVEKKNGARLQQRVHSWLEDKTLPDCKYKHGAGGFLFFFFFFRPAHSHTYHRRAIKVFEGKKKYPSKPDSCLLSIEVALWSYEASGGFVFAWFIFMARQIWRLSKCQGHLSCGSSAALGFFFFCTVRKRGAGPYCVS